MNSMIDPAIHSLRLQVEELHTGITMIRSEVEWIKHKQDEKGRQIIKQAIILLVSILAAAAVCIFFTNLYIFSRN